MISVDRERFLFISRTVVLLKTSKSRPGEHVKDKTHRVVLLEENNQ